MWRNKTVQGLLDTNLERERQLLAQNERLLELLLAAAGHQPPQVYVEPPQAEPPERLLAAEQIFDLDRA